mmetsp:Transcript_24859/g.48328  ORF Transcript_24859/g.48328 Transcript_24859/m.48328 type:complete len:132 (+) Transcript_24859:55-450(+)
MGVSSTRVGDHRGSARTVQPFNISLLFFCLRRARTFELSFYLVFFSHVFFFLCCLHFLCFAFNIAFRVESVYISLKDQFESNAFSLVNQFESFAFSFDCQLESNLKGVEFSFQHSVRGLWFALLLPLFIKE